MLMHYIFLDVHISINLPDHFDLICLITYFSLNFDLICLITSTLFAWASISRYISTNLPGHVGLVYLINREHHFIGYRLLRSQKSMVFLFCVG